MASSSSRDVQHGLAQDAALLQLSQRDRRLLERVAAADDRAELAAFDEGVDLVHILPRVCPAEEQAEVKALLERMAEAVRVLDYQGTFVYLQNNQLEALEIEHRRGESGTRERLFSLNGSAREVVRDGATVTCILPDLDSVLVDQRVAQGSFPDLLGIGIDELAENYRFEWLGHDRVAGRAAQVVAIVPRDNLRYGYRLYLDRDSGLPLKLDLMDEAGDPVEQARVYDAARADELVFLDITRRIP